MTSPAYADSRRRICERARGHRAPTCSTVPCRWAQSRPPPPPPAVRAERPCLHTRTAVEKDHRTTAVGVPPASPLPHLTARLAPLRRSLGSPPQSSLALVPAARLRMLHRRLQESQSYERHQDRRRRRRRRRHCHAPGPRLAIGECAPANPRRCDRHHSPALSHRQRCSGHGRHRQLRRHGHHLRCRHGRRYREARSSADAQLSAAEATHHCQWSANPVALREYTAAQHPRY